MARPKRERGETRAAVERLAGEGLRPAQIAVELGIARPTVSYHLRALGIGGGETSGRRYDWTEIRRHYEAGHSFRECQERFGFCGAAWFDAIQRGDIVPRDRALPIGDLLATGRSRTNLRRRLVAEGLKPAHCEECGISEWRGAPLALQLHHVNGDGRDNRLDNLQVLCPNCHAQTDSWGGRNKRRPLRAVPVDAGDEADPAAAECRVNAV